MNKLFSAILLLILFATVDILCAQRVDFEEFPQLDANYTHLKLELHIDEGLLFRGDALYDFMLLRDDVDSLRLDAIRMDIGRVELDGENAEFWIDDDQLVVNLNGDAETGRSYSLRIIYQANPRFGIFEDHKGTIWSSGLPGSVRHWLPAMDHPRNSLTTDVTFIFPTGRSVVFSGTASEAEVESVDTQRVRFQVDRELPVSSLRFAIGDFEQTQTSIGQHQIRLYSERGLLNNEEKAGLLDDAYVFFRHAERTLGSSYPLQTLQVIILEDDKWESKNYGAGTVFGFKNQKDLTGQIAHGVIGQWAGVRVREEQWSDANAIMLLQAWLYEQSDELQERRSEQPSPPEFHYESIYRAFDTQSRLAWTDFIKNDDSEIYRTALSSTADNLMEGLPSVIKWYDFASYLYGQTGRNLLEIPEPSVPGAEERETIPEYRVIYYYDEGEDRLRLEFRSLNGSVDELVTLIAEEYSFNDIRSREITFTGSRDEVVLNVNRGIENLKLTVAEEVETEVQLRPEKPFMFWIYQLRNDDDPESRAAAARGLKNYSDNPDLQLALLDIIQAEENPEVYAEVIRTLASVTCGASGTDQLFRQRFNLNSDPEMQKAVVEALANYSNNDAVINQLRNAIINSQSVEVKEQAVRSLASVAQPEHFRSLSESILSNDAAVEVAPLILRELARAGEAEAAVSMASAFLDDRYPYVNRVKVLDLLLDYDDSADRWASRIQLLAADNDPRIRLRALDGLQFLSGSDRNEIIEDRLYEEHDDRIISRLQQLGQ